MAKDDPMVLPEDVPVDLILENPNALLINSAYGSHCNFFTREENGPIERLYPDIVIKYIEEVSKYNKD